MSRTRRRRIALASVNRTHYGSRVFRRPAAAFAATLIDYLIWRVSAGSGLQLLGLVSGLLLLPLLILTVAFAFTAFARRAAHGSVAENVPAPARTVGQPGAQAAPRPEKHDERMAA